MVVLGGSLRALGYVLQPKGQERGPGVELRSRCWRRDDPLLAAWAAGRPQDAPPYPGRECHRRGGSDFWCSSILILLWYILVYSNVFWYFCSVFDKMASVGTLVGRRDPLLAALPWPRVGPARGQGYARTSRGKRNGGRGYQTSGICCYFREFVNLLIRALAMT